MKQLLFLFVIFSSFTTINSPKEEKILGEWKIVKSVYKEKISYSLYKERISGTENNFRINFKSDRTATVSTPKSAPTETVDWSIENKNITLNYKGQHAFLNTSNGTHKIKALNNSRMELLDAAETTTIYFER